MKYKKLLALTLVVFAVALSVPGCGKKGDDKKPGTAPGNTFGVNGFSIVSGGGQASILSLNSCYNVYKQSDGTLKFPIATAADNPHYINGGYLYATAYVANAAYMGGNTYKVNSAYGDTIDISITGNDQYFSGVVTLSSTTVRDIQTFARQYLRGNNDPNIVCVDGVTFDPATINGNRIQGQIWLYVNDYPVIKF